MSNYEQYWPIFLAALGALMFAVGAIVVSLVLTRRNPNPAKQEPYECGIPPLSPARVQISVKFYLIALLFLLFDMETMFILLWAVAYRDLPWRLFALGEMAVFVAILLVGYIYAWRKGALRWN